LPTEGRARDIYIRDLHINTFKVKRLIVTKLQNGGGPESRTSTRFGKFIPTLKPTGGDQTVG
jgi:hypothetical protein